MVIDHSKSYGVRGSEQWRKRVFKAVESEMGQRYLFARGVTECVVGDRKVRLGGVQVLTLKLRFVINKCVARYQHMGSDLGAVPLSFSPDIIQALTLYRVKPINEVTDPRHAVPEDGI